DGVYFNYPFIWECKALSAKNWRALGRDGLEKTFARYSVQVWLYQAYLDLTSPALFSAINADTCEQLHFWVPFDVERAQMWSDRVANIIRATRAGELLDRAYDDPNDWRLPDIPPQRAQGYRVAGTPNYPTAAKQTRGRTTVESTRISEQT